MSCIVGGKIKMHSLQIEKYQLLPTILSLEVELTKKIVTFKDLAWVLNGYLQKSTYIFVTPSQHSRDG